MNAAMKRLCAAALAFFMVLAMAPATALVADAAEELPTGIALGETVKNNSAEVKDFFVNATGDVTAVCPVCKANGDATEKTWTAIKADIVIKDKASVVAMAGGHFYFAEDLVKDYSYVLGGFFSGSGCLNLNGKTVTLNGGKLVELSAGNTMNIMDTAGGAVVTGSVDQYGNDGKVIRVKEDGAALNLFGGTYQGMNDTYTAYGSDTDNANGSATIAVRGGTLNMYEGVTIVGIDGTTGNTSKYGGAVYLNNANTPVFNMYGGTIRDGKATYGGNVSILQGKAVFNMYGGEILGGTATYGGNVYVHCAGASSYGTMKMYGGFITSGKATNVNYGNNVYLGTYKSNDVTYCTAVFEMSGGTIVGDVCGGYGANSNRAVNLSGSAKIVTKAMHNGQLYTGSAGLVRCTFDAKLLGEGSDVWSGQLLAESRAYCAACKSVPKWITISEPQTMTAGGHYRLMADLAYTYETEGDSSFLSGVGCFDLNGCDLTIDGGRFLLAQTAGTVNIFDTFGGAVVTGSNDYYSEGGLTIRTNAANAVVNLYGGTYKGMEDTATTEGRENSNSPLVRMRAGGELNLYSDATVDGSNLSRTCASIYLGYNASTPTTFNIVGGTVIGGTNTNADGVGGAFRVGNTAGDAALNLISGKIVGGNARLGDAVCVRPGNTFSMEGGMVVDGEKGTGRVIYLGKNTSGTGANAVISGGVIVGELYAEENSSIELSGKAAIVTSYEDYTAARALTLKTGAILNVDSLAAEAEIVLSNAGDYLGTAFTVASENAAIARNAFVVADRYRVATNENGQLVITNPAAGVQFSEDEAVWFDSAEEAVNAYDFSKNQVLVVYADSVTINGDVYLDVRNDVEVQGAGTVYGIDRSNDSLKTYHKITAAEGIEVVADVTDPIYGNRYVAVAEEGTYGFHRLNIKLSTVTLRTAKAGIYYKAAMSCDDVLKAQIAHHGVAVSVVSMPTIAFESDENTAYTQLDGAPFDTFTSGSVANIFRSNLSAEKNAARGTMKIYANAYLKLNDGTILMAENAAAWSMRDVMDYLNTNFETLDADIQAQAKSFYATWADVMASWELDKLAAVESV